MLAYSELDMALDLVFAVVVLCAVAIGLKRLVWRARQGRQGGASVSDAARDKAQQIAAEARHEAVSGLFLFGFLLGPVALWRVSRARKLLADADEPRPDLARHLRHTQVIAALALVLWVGLLAYCAIQKGR